MTDQQNQIIPEDERLQQLETQLQHTNKQISDLLQQKSLIEDLIQSANNQAQQIIGALNERKHMITELNITPDIANQGKG